MAAYAFRTVGYSSQTIVPMAPLTAVPQSLFAAGLPGCPAGSPVPWSPLGASVLYDLMSSLPDGVIAAGTSELSKLCEWEAFLLESTQSLWPEPFRSTCAPDERSLELLDGLVAELDHILISFSNVARGEGFDTFSHYAQVGRVEDIRKAIILHRGNVQVQPKMEAPGAP